MKIWGIVILVLVVLGIGGGFGAYKFGEHQGYSQAYGKAYAKGKKDESAAEYAAALATGFQRSQLNTCLDNVDTWYDANRANVTTINQENALNDEKQQRVQECQLRYPVK